MYKKIGLRHLYFNRFLLIRYVTAFFLFLNLYWLIFLLGSLSVFSIIPLSVFILGILTAIEQVKLYRNHSNQLPYASYFYKSIIVICFLLLIITNSSLYYLAFPFLKNIQIVLNALNLLFVINLSLSCWMVIRLNKIKRDEDKHFKRIQSYEKIIN